MEHPTELYSKGRLQALTANVRLGYKWTVTTTLAYNSAVLVTTVKSFILSAQEANLKRKLISHQLKTGPMLSESLDALPE